MKKRNRILSLVLALLLSLGLCAPAFAEGDIGKVGERNIISAGDRFTAAVDENGALWMWGDNFYDQLGNNREGNSSTWVGNGYTTIQTVPDKVLDNVATVSCGSRHSAAIKTDGSLWTWGDGVDFQLGIDIFESSLVSNKVMDNASAISCGGIHSAAIKTDGSLWMWGANYNGQLGNDRQGDVFGAYQIVPVKVLDDVTAVSCGGNHTAAIKTDGSLWMWGSNSSGQLGNGGQGNDRNYDGFLQTVPVKVLDDVVAVSCGVNHTAAIKTDGSLWTWGDNYCCQLGNGTTDNSNIPVKVLDNVAFVSCGYQHTAAIKTDGTLWTWGSNSSGQLGNDRQGNDTVNNYGSQYLIQTIPVKVMDNAATVSCGNSHTIAVKTDGTLWTWGENHYGQLGNNRQGNASDNYVAMGVNMSSPLQTVPAQITLGGGASMPRGVRLNLNGGYGGDILWTSADGTITVPTNPTRPGYTFGGWYTDAALTIPWNFNDKVVNVLVLYAKWTPVSSTAATTGKNSQTVSINGSSASLDAYTLIADNGGEVTYVKLRDIAALLEDTEAKFNVDWRNRAIYVSTGTAYTTKNGTELKPVSGTDGSYKWNTAPVLFDGVTKSLEGIVLTDSEGGGHTFFKLRDLGDAIGFDVGWSAERGIYIETD